MPVTLVVTRNVEDRYRGFLASMMLEISPGTYLAPIMSKGVRERTWAVLEEWHAALGTGSLLMAWPDGKASSGIGLLTLGEIPREIVDVDGLRLVRKRG